MLLGIVLHGALAFIPGAWVVTDASVEGDGEAFALLTTAIHGFRMPVFFLMSGFFTAMLWRQRSLPAMVRHRAQRILLPLVIATFTVIPLIGVAWSYAAGASADAGDAAAAEVKAEHSVWAAAALGDAAALERHVAGGASLDEYDPAFGVTPLSWAALHGRAEAAEWLLNSGADIGSLNRDGSTALHSAAFMGRTEVVQLLLERGAGASAADANGALPLDSSRVDLQTTEWVAALLGVPFDKSELEEGRREVAQLLGSTAERTDAAGGVAPYRDSAGLGGERGPGSASPVVLGVAVLKALAFAVHCGRLQPPLVPLVSRLAGWSVRAVRMGRGTAGPTGASTTGAAGRYPGALPVGGAVDHGNAALHGHRGAYPGIRVGHLYGVPAGAARIGLLRRVLRLWRRLLRAQRGRHAHRSRVATDAGARPRSCYWPAPA